MEEADQPDPVLDLTDTHQLAGKHGAQVDLAPAQADPATAGDADGAIRPGRLRAFSCRC